MHPLLILAVGVAIVLGLILGARLNAFFALITAAVVVSLLAPPGDSLAAGESDKISRVAEAFGVTAGKIGIVIALAAVIGKCLLDSGAADRIALAFLRFFGRKRGDLALAASGFVLSAPVFFDTVFYLLFPLARSMYRQTGRHYLRYVIAIGAGAIVTHTLVPPTPGPLIMAEQLDFDVGVMILMGGAIGIPCAMAGLAYGAWIDRRLTLELNPTADLDQQSTETSDLPRLVPSLAPIVLPVLLISGKTIIDQFAKGAPSESGLTAAAAWMDVLGNANFALLLSAIVALWLYVARVKPTRDQTAAMIEEALMSGGVIILITAAGGAFGAMLGAAEIAPTINKMFTGGDAALSGLALLWFAFLVTSLLKFSQGSSTVAMITGSAMLGAMIEGATLQYHPVYLAAAIGCGSMVGVWMNDSGFWIFCKMSRLTATEGLKSWTAAAALCGIVGMLTTTLLALALPMAN